MISINVKGDFKKTTKFLKQMSDSEYFNILSKYGEEGVKALSAATPKESGKTSKSWSYEIRRWKRKDSSGATISWTNSNFIDGVPIAILLQYGHASRNGSFVRGVDYINPALKPIFDKIANNVWEEVVK